MAMHPTLRTTSVLLMTCIFSLLVADQAEARRNRRNTNYQTTNTNTTYTGSVSKRIAPKRDPASAQFPGLAISYRYEIGPSNEEAIPDSLRVSICISDARVLQEDGPLFAEVKIADLSNSKIQHVRYVPLTIERKPHGSKPSKTTSAFFDVPHEDDGETLVQPGHVYRLFVNLHRKGDTYGAKSVVGRIPSPYYVATSDDTRISFARQKIVTRTFKEFYYRQHGWNTGERYSMDCYAYYMWATGFCTVGAENGRTKLHKLFGIDVPYNSGSHIPKLVSHSTIHGDYVRKPGHSFMLLAYDAHQKQVWTMEGNFNGTVEVVIRSLDSGWKVGHLRDRHIRSGLFERTFDRIRDRQEKRRDG